MAINRIVTGQTFGNWLDTTNQMINDLNEANAIKTANKLVRYDSTGSLTIHDVTANSIALLNGTRIDRIHTDYNTFEDDNTVLTANATYQAIRAEDKTTIKDTPGGQAANTYVVASLADVKTFVDGALKVTVANTVTTFEEDVVIEKNLLVKGTKTEFNTATLNVEDNNIVLNKGGTLTTAELAGFDVEATNASFRLVDSGNRFPKFGATEVAKTVTLNVFTKKFEIGTVPREKIIMNEKDMLKLTYQINTSTKPMSNTVPLAIGTVSGNSRESYILEPDSSASSTTSRSEISYKIGGTFYNTYAAYKAAFLAETNATVEITFDPASSGKYYYLSGNIINTTVSGEVLFSANTPGSGFSLDIPLGGTVETNPTIELDLGDTFVFRTHFDKPGHNTYPFAIGTASYGDPNMDANKIFGVGADVTYEINGTVYDGSNGNANDFNAYKTAWQAATTGFANVTFAPSVTTGTYFYWNTSDSNTFTANGQIAVSANNISMGGEIEVGYPMGLFFTRGVTYGGSGYLLNSAPNAQVNLDSGDTITFNMTVANHPNAVFGIGNSNTAGYEAAADNYIDGVTYELDGVIYDQYTAYKAAFAAATYANVTFTPVSAGDFYYWANNNVAHGGTIVVASPRASSLSTFELKSDTNKAIIENPLEFTVTKNHNSVLTMDGDFANFRGTKSGVVLPSESLDYTPTQDGIIRYNPAQNLFEGYTQGQWRGLGGVVDLNQDTKIEAGDTDDILYHTANGTIVAQVTDTNNFLTSTRTATDGNGVIRTGTIRVEGNANTTVYEIFNTGTIDETAISGNTYSGTTSLLVEPQGVDVRGTGYFKLPVGTTSQRPEHSANGMLRFVSGGIEIHDATTSTSEYFNSLEMYNGENWEALNSVVNEYTFTVTAATTQIPFTNLSIAFQKNEIDIYIDGIRIQKGEYSLTSVPVGSLFTSTLAFATPRPVGQIITVVHQPGRKIGITTINTVNRSELSSGYTDDVRFTGNTIIGTSQPSTSITTGALVVQGGVGVSGDLFVGSSVTELSAGELKENISSIDSAMDKVMALNGVEFTWKHDRESKKEYGLLAENVADVVPNLASFDTDSNPSGVKYSKVVALLIEGMKQQQQEINELRSQLPKKRIRKSKSV